MLKFKENGQVPPGFFTFIVPETGYKISEFSKEEMFRKIKLHYDTNGIPLPENYKEIIEDRICKRLDGEWCSEGAKEYTGKGCKIGLAELFKGAVSIAQLIIAKFKDKEIFVKQEIAEERALICSRCPLNISTGACLSCGSMLKITQATEGIKGEKKTEVDHLIDNCCICKCRLSLIVHLTNEINNAGQTEESMLQYPIWCWKRNNLEDAKENLKLCQTQPQTI